MSAAGDCGSGSASGSEAAKTMVAVEGGAVRIAIVGADLGALELAEFLAARGRLVSVLEAGKTIAPEVGNKRKTEHMDRLDRLGVTVNVQRGGRRDRARRCRLPPAAAPPHLAADNVVIAGSAGSRTPNCTRSRRSPARGQVTP